MLANLAAARGNSQQLAEQGAGGDKGRFVAGEGVSRDEFAVDDELEGMRRLELLLEMGERGAESFVGVFYLKEKPRLLVADDDKIDFANISTPTFRLVLALFSDPIKWLQFPLACLIILAECNEGHRSRPRGVPERLLASVILFKAAERA